MTDLVQRLRGLHRKGGLGYEAHDAIVEAADEIERLATEFQKMTDHLFKTRVAALEEAAVLTETWYTRDGALADADDAKHEIARLIRALKNQVTMQGDDMNKPIMRPVKPEEDVEAAVADALEGLEVKEPGSRWSTPRTMRTAA